MTVSDYVHSTAGGTTSDSDDAETSNEQGITGRCEKDGSNVASVTSLVVHSCVCNGEAC